MIAYLGPNGTFTSCALEALMSRLNISDSTMSCKSIDHVFELLNRDEVKSIFIPIENSTGGDVSISSDCLLNLSNEYYVQYEYECVIEQSLFSKEKCNYNHITDIFTHNQSFYQCRKFLKSLLSHCEVHFCSSNAQAAQIVSSNNYVFNDSKKHCLACIGHKSFENFYSLNLVSSNIHDEINNKTRFFFIGKGLKKKSEHNKTSIVFSPRNNKSGSLCDILSILSEKNLNMTRINSRPTKKKLGEYLFFIDFEGFYDDLYVKSVLNNISKKSNWFKLLGSYEVIS